MANKKSFFNEYSKNETFEYLDNTLDKIEEATNYVVKYNKKTTYKRLLKRAELKIAHNNDDPLLRKYLKASKIRRETRKAMHEKYGGKASMQVRAWVKARRERDKLAKKRKKLNGSGEED